MRWLSPLLAAFVLLTTTLALAPSASAACGDRLTNYGGVVGLTDEFVADSAGAACGPDTDPTTYSDLACVWLWGVDCDHIDDQAIALVTYFLP